MRKMKTIMGALLAIFVLNACDNEVPEQNNNPLSEDGRVYNFDVEDYEWDNENGSRTNLSTSGAFSWAEGDTIGIMPDEGSQVYFVISPEDAGKSSASFSGGAWALKAGNKYAAYYPFVEDILLDKTKVPVDYTGQVAAGQTMDNAGAFDFLATTASEANETGGLNFSFSHLGTPVRLKFTLPAPCEVKQIILTAEREVFPLTAYMDLTKEKIALTWGEEDLSRTFYIGVEDVATTEKEQEVVVYFMMPPVDLSGENTLAMTVILEEGENVLYQLEGKQLMAGRGSSWTGSPLQQSYGDYCDIYSQIGDVIKEKMDEYGVAKLKFVANSTVTSKFVFWWNAPFYTVKNGEWLEIHTPAKKFRAYNGALQFNSSNYFKYALMKEIDLSDVDFSQVQDMGNMFYKCMSLEKVTFPKDINTPNLVRMQQMFYECPELTSLDLSGFDTENVIQTNGMFYNCSKLASITLGEGFKTGKLQWMQDMFNGCTSLESLDLSSFNTENVTYMYNMFSGCSKLASITLGDGFNTENVTDMSSMFYNCSSLTSLDLSSFNTEKVTHMGNMFAGCSKLASITFGDGFKTDAVQSMAYMFSNCSSLTSLDLSGFRTDNVQYIYGMFNNCSSLTSLDLSGFNTGNVTEMSSMFSGCSSLTSLDLSSFNTEKVEWMGSMFSGCSSLTSLDLSGFNTDNVTQMSYMFQYCSSLTSLDLSNFNTEQVTSMSFMFQNCSSLTSLDLSNFNTENVMSMWAMFQNCSSLTSLDLSNFNTSKVSDMDNMFENCLSLASLDLSSFTFVAYNVYNTFLNTGADCADKPIDILVSEEGKAFLESKINVVRINPEYATLVVKAN